MALWSIEWLVRTEGGEREVPAFSFLLVQPAAVWTQLLAISSTLCERRDPTSGETPPRTIRCVACAPSFTRLATGTAMLYRLYLRWQREHHRVVIVDGGAKPNSERAS